MENVNKTDNYFFDKDSNIEECLSEVYLVENGNINLEDLVIENDEIIDNVRQFDLYLYDEFIAIVSIFIHPINEIVIINYKKIGSFFDVMTSQDEINKLLN